MKQKLREYSSAIYRAFFDVNLYRHAVSAWRGFGGGYLFILSMILSLMIVLTVILSAARFGRDELPKILVEMPHIVIDKGAVTVESGKDPAVIQTSDKKLRFIVDTKSSEEKLLKEDAAFILGKDFVLVKKAVGYDRQPLNGIKRTEINRHTIKKLWPKIYSVIAFMWPIVVLGQFILLLFYTVIVAVLTYVVTAFIREEYNFETRMRLSALALTPGLLISQFAALAMQHQTAGWFPLLLSLLYVYAMILLGRREDKKPVVNDGNS